MWKGRDGLFNPMTCEPSRMAMHRGYSGRGGACVGYTKRPMGHPAHKVDETFLAEFVSLGVVSDSWLLAVHDERKCKYVKALIPSSVSDRIQAIVRVGLRRMSTIVLSQISNLGFDFSTRSMSILNAAEQC